ncbi:hypothetical protein IWX90DRAFT_217573 [Phyllosticta citrichinensis]|uniref:Uncharacterized protein n=1 Tax=Phyllosticta citrichinensis TaxID=1130410 RepID=A0ABR1XTI9_9PEZI
MPVRLFTSFSHSNTLSLSLSLSLSILFYMYFPFPASPGCSLATKRGSIPTLCLSDPYSIHHTPERWLYNIKAPPQRHLDSFPSKNSKAQQSKAGFTSTASDLCLLRPKHCASDRLTRNSKRKSVASIEANIQESKKASAKNKGSLILVRASWPLCALPSM